MFPQGSQGFRPVMAKTLPKDIHSSQFQHILDGQYTTKIDLISSNFTYLELTSEFTTYNLYKKNR